MFNLNTGTPTEEQLKDPKWWNENTLEGTTHYLPTMYGVHSAWIKCDKNTVFFNYEAVQGWNQWHSFESYINAYLIKRPEENKRMKGSDVVSVELTGYELAKIYAILGHVNGDPSVWRKVQKLLKDPEQAIYNSIMQYKSNTESYMQYCDIWHKAILEPETPVLTEAQKKALELKETIAKAQQQLEELEKQI